MIEISSVTHCFNNAFTLCDITLRFDEQRIAIIGGNGSGKSTLARMLNGLLLPDSGDVLVDGLSTKREAAKVRGLVGYVFQNPEHQIVMPTLEEDLAFGLWNMNLAKDEVTARVDAMLAAHGLEAKRHSPAHLLSGGEQKLLTLLSVLIMEPRYIVFDEPMNSLDLRARRRLASVMAGLQQNIITITHDFELIADYDRAILLHEGRVAGDGLPADVVQQYIALADARGEG
ncbi:MAG: ABC transporter ATP-binding protein [Alphaproteobacteria bacterium]